MLKDNTLKQVFRDHWNTFLKKWPYYDCEQYVKPVSKMLHCGEPSQGYASYVCECCGEIKKVAFSCKSNFCLSCNKVSVEKFALSIGSNLHEGVKYHQLVVTIPKQYRKFFFADKTKSDLLNTFYRTAYEFYREIIQTYVGKDLLVGAIVVIHTHGRSGNYHPHLHLLVTAGGLDSKEKKWYTAPTFDKDLIAELKVKWKDTLIDMMESKCGEEVEEANRILRKYYKKGFHLDISSSNAPSSMEGLRKYLGRYLSAPPISLRRILEYNGEEVTYCYDSHQSKERVIETVGVYDFIGRMVQHLRVKHFQKVRYFGLQASKTYSTWKKVLYQALHKAGYLVKMVMQLSFLKNYRERYFESSKVDPFRCKNCGEEMSLWYLWSKDYVVFYDAFRSAPNVIPEEPPPDMITDEVLNTQLSFI